MGCFWFFDGIEWNEAICCSNPSARNLGFFDRFSTYSKKWSTTIVVSHILDIHTYIIIHAYRACGISSILYLASKPLINLDAHPGSIYVHILPDHQISNLSQCSNQNLTLEGGAPQLQFGEKKKHELSTRNPDFAALENNFDNDLGHDMVIWPLVSWLAVKSTKWMSYPPVN